uniref:Uncharacterized protein n=1 Tax=Tetranychus urticae TaxID=32264 RepID=T1KKW3_TETUR
MCFRVNSSFAFSCVFSKQASAYLHLYLPSELVEQREDGKQQESQLE